MQYEWDSEKNKLNIRKHRISFEQAVEIFEGPVVERMDDREDYGETRVFALGLVKGRETVVVYTDREDARRIISARRAKSYECRIYWEKLEF